MKTNVIFLELHPFITKAAFGTHAWCIKAKITGQQYKNRLMEADSMQVETQEPSTDETNEDYPLDFPNHS